MKQVTGSCVLVVFGLVFTGMGGAMTVFITIIFLSIMDSWGWDPVPAEIVSAKVEFPDKPPQSDEHDIFTLQVDYCYDYGDQSYNSTDFGLQTRSSESYEKLALLRRDILAGKFETAYVNPDDPAQAILKRDSLLFGFVILFPLLFVVVGVLMLVACLPIWGNRRQGGIVND